MEMPGLRLTTAQAARLWNLSVRTPSACWPRSSSAGS
jgi:hypothetical protein